ncbi:unnamed protein product, partial [Brassica rapa subsp. trilocularis]
LACLIKLLGDRGVVDLGIGDAKTVFLSGIVEDDMELLY